MSSQNGRLDGELNSARSIDNGINVANDMFAPFNWLIQVNAWRYPSPISHLLRKAADRANNSVRNAAARGASR